MHEEDQANATGGANGEAEHRPEFRRVSVASRQVRLKSLQPFADFLSGISFGPVQSTRTIPELGTATIGGLRGGNLELFHRR